MVVGKPRVSRDPTEAGSRHPHPLSGLWRGEKSHVLFCTFCFYCSRKQAWALFVCLKQGCVTPLGQSSLWASVTVVSHVGAASSVNAPSTLPAILCQALYIYNAPGSPNIQVRSTTPVFPDGVTEAHRCQVIQPRSHG